MEKRNIRISIKHIIHSMDHNTFYSISIDDTPAEYYDHKMKIRTRLDDRFLIELNELNIELTIYEDVNILNVLLKSMGLKTDDELKTNEDNTYWILKEQIDHYVKECYFKKRQFISSYY